MLTLATATDTFAVFVCTLLHSVSSFLLAVLDDPWMGRVASGTRIADESREGHEKGGKCWRTNRQKITGVEV